MPRGKTKPKNTYKTFLREIEKLICGETDPVHRWENYTAEIYFLLIQTTESVQHNSIPAVFVLFCFSKKLTG